MGLLPKFDDKVIRFRAIEHNPVPTHEGDWDACILRHEATWIFNLKATKLPCLNDSLSFKPFLKIFSFLGGGSFADGSTNRWGHILSFGELAYIRDIVLWFSQSSHIFIFFSQLSVSARAIYSIHLYICDLLEVYFICNLFFIPFLPIYAAFALPC